MTDLEKLKKLLPADHSYTDDELNDLLVGSNIYSAAAFVLRSIVAQIIAGTYSFSSGEVRIDKTALVENYKKLIEEYEANAKMIASPPSSTNQLWKTEIDRLSGADYTDYAD